MSDDRACPETDRRSRPTPMLSRHWLRGRRREGGERAYVDRYRREEWRLILAILIFGVADLILTILHLERGGGEANPLMRLVLRGGYGWFAFIKLAVTAGGLLFALVHIRFRYVRLALLILFWLSAALFLYHIYVRIAA